MSFIVLILSSPKPPTPKFCQSSFSSLLISLGTHLQHIEGNVLKNKNPYSAHNFGLLCLQFFSSELCSLWVVSKNIKMIIVSLGSCSRCFKVLNHNTALDQVLHVNFTGVEKYIGKETWQWPSILHQKEERLFCYFLQREIFLSKLIELGIIGVKRDTMKCVSSIKA